MRGHVDVVYTRGCLAPRPVSGAYRQKTTKFWVFRHQRATEETDQDEIWQVSVYHGYCYGMYACVTQNSSTQHTCSRLCTDVLLELTSERLHCSKSRVK